MPDQSVRSYIASLQQQNEITRFTKEIDPDTNLSAVSWRNFAQRGKGCLFENIKGHPDWKVVSQIVADRRKWGVALGVSEDEVVSTLGERINQPIAPVMVSRDKAPVKEVIKIGAEVDLTKIPAMWTSEADPSRYIASGMCIIKDPQTGIRNVSFHRAQVLGPNTTGYLICPRQALKIYQMYGELKKPMEAAMVIGAHPSMVFSAGFVAPYGQDELSIAGGVIGEPIRLVKCETIDMEVPAEAELVLEGELIPGEMTPEGPFGEVTGGYAQEGSTPMFRIKAITHRKDPIFYAMQCGLAPSDAHSIVCTTIEMRLWQYLKDVAGGLDLIDVRCIAGMTPMMVVLKVREKFAGQARAAALAALSSPYLHPKIAVVVNEDIDIRDMSQVYWAIAHRTRDRDDLQKLDNVRVFTLDNASPIEPGMSAMYRVGTKVLIDATEEAVTRKAPPMAAPGGAAPAGLTDRSAIFKALGMKDGTLLADLIAKLVAGGKAPQAAAAKRAAGSADKLPKAGRESPLFGAILAVQSKGDGPTTLGLVTARRESDRRLSLRYPSWRLSAAIKAPTYGRVPAALVIGAPAACALGAALHGWRGRNGWDHAAAISGSLALARSKDGVLTPEAAPLVIHGALTVTAGTGEPTWSFDIESVEGDASKVVLAGGAERSAEAAAFEALATELTVVQHIVQIEGGLDVLDARCYPETDHRVIVVKMRPRVGGQSKTACMGALSSPDIGPRLVIAVDDDVNATDLRDVSWSFASRLHAQYDVQAIEGLPASEGTASAIAPAFKWFVDSTKPPLTQKVDRDEFDRAIPKNFDKVKLEDFLSE